ncbi:imidazole glycerol phosphate synthase subunit HisH [Kamptonema cortianum]|nr:imidazole glycerol phosphate synthase subunit HisH [Kamptonema cortianum]MDL5046176.1 imidazole glycerol phosphate synthase subunit HisH [Oscillatoria amoena NRMC-F 0135]
MIGLIDYDIGNLRSARRALEKTGAPVTMVRSPEELKEMDAAVLPGVGAFGDCMKSLRARGFEDAVKQFAGSGKPFLGICVGLQMLFERSHENGIHEGLGLLPGEIRLLKAPGQKIPQIGWNTIAIEKENCPIFKGISNGSYFYFVHSYAVETPDASIVAARTEYGVSYPSIVWRDNIFATQFHPEKSQRVGLQLLENFGALAG